MTKQLLLSAQELRAVLENIEPIDAVAGHIPGSVNYPYNINLAPNDTFKPVEEIRRDLRNLRIN